MAGYLEQCSFCGTLKKTDRHWTAVIKIIANHIRINLCAWFGIEIDCCVYSDADDGDESNDRRSVSETVVTLGGAAVSLANSVQRCVTLYTPGAEYVDLGEYGRKFCSRAWCYLLFTQS